MNTKSYLKLFKDMLESGELPQDVYDDVTSRIAERGKLTPEIYAHYLDELERRRLFDADGAPFDTKNSAKTDGTYVYRHPKNPFWYIFRGICMAIYSFVGWLGSGLVYGLWFFPRSEKKKFKGVDACITLSNHVGYMDGCLTRRATGFKRLYIAAAPHNCKNNIGGALLAGATVIPLPTGFRGAKPFNEMLEFAKTKGAAVHFYAEKSMWLRYRKPRPYKDGAFHYAVKLDIPIVPMLYCFEDSKGLRKLFGLPKATVRIADPVYPDSSLPAMKRKADMRARVEAATRELYENFYGVPLEYLPEYTNTQQDPDTQASETSNQA